MRRFLWKVATNTLLAIVIGAAPTAQLNTQHIKGTVGLKAGRSHRLPASTSSRRSFYVYKADEVKNRTADTLFRQRGLTQPASQAAASTSSRTKKLFGGFYGFQVAVPASAPTTGSRAPKSMPIPAAA